MFIDVINRVWKGYVGGVSWAVLRFARGAVVHGFGVWHGLVGLGLGYGFGFAWLIAVLGYVGDVSLRYRLIVFC